MTENDKKLLLTDLSARMPYGVKLKVENDHIYGSITVIPHSLLDLDCFDCHTEDFKYEQSYDLENIIPYLRPLSSMSKDEEENLRRNTGAKLYSYNLFGKPSYKISFPSTDEWGHDETYDETDWIKVFNWLNEHHFDYNKLIEKGLAIEAIEGIY